MSKSLYIAVALHMITNRHFENSNKNNKMRKVLFITAIALYFVGSSTIFAQNERQELKLKKAIDSISKLELSLHKQKKNLKKEIHELESHDVNRLTQKQFAIDFSDIKDVIWHKLEYCDKATFLNNGCLTKAYYNASHELMGTTTHKTLADLPEKAQAKINDEYGDYEKSHVIYYDASDIVNSEIVIYDREYSEPDSYYIELTKNDSEVVLGFNNQGKLIFNKKIK